MRGHRLAEFVIRSRARMRDYRLAGLVIRSRVPRAYNLALRANFIINSYAKHDIMNIMFIYT